MWSPKISISRILKPTHLWTCSWREVEAIVGTQKNSCRRREEVIMRLQGCNPKKELNRNHKNWQVNLQLEGGRSNCWNPRPMSFPRPSVLLLPSPSLDIPDKPWLSILRLFGGAKILFGDCGVSSKCESRYSRQTWTINSISETFLCGVGGPLGPCLDIPLKPCTINTQPFGGD